MSSEVQGSLWEIYQDIGRSDASKEMTDTQKVQLVKDLRDTADKLEASILKDKGENHG
ncbi:hypothetical protein ST201phi2-1p095 [Pseudomonas phage 201phi2-1]|uniref:Uncharacterized protein n=1 Tax=Pseudomonas phage 201phi2-1 TaxID=198110 RepID=B3FIV9_BP201|nr:hypothetical protein ST201phi2-1p095 [Pseudomonas phage 201phi2-1]ABY62928.1 hypothetical protein 201phi2-1p095 [Pseudomonas phage 201phi2-1]